MSSLKRMLKRNEAILPRFKDRQQRIIAVLSAERLGWQRCGSVPGYALLPEGGLCATTFYWRDLDGRAAG